MVYIYEIIANVLWDIQYFAQHFEHSLQIKWIFTQQAPDMNLIHKQHADVTISSSLVSLLSNPFQALAGMKEQTQRERNRDEGSYF